MHECMNDKVAKKGEHHTRYIMSISHANLDFFNFFHSSPRFVKFFTPLFILTEVIETDAHLNLVFYIRNCWYFCVEMGIQQKWFLEMRILYIFFPEFWWDKNQWSTIFSSLKRNKSVKQRIIKWNGQNKFGVENGNKQCHEHRKWWFFGWLFCQFISLLVKVDRRNWCFCTLYKNDTRNHCWRPTNEKKKVKILKCP